MTHYDEQAVLNYFRYSERVKQLRHELRISQMMLRDAEQTLREGHIFPYETITWTED